jgi:hypothetical protein
MSIVVWTSADVAELRPALHKAGLGSAVLVPIDGGTAIVPSDRTPVSLAASWAYKIKKKVGRSAVALVWDDHASAIYPVTGAVALGWEWGGDEAARQLIAHLGDYGAIRKAGLAVAGRLATPKTGSAKQERAAQRIAEAFEVDVAAILPHVRRFEHRLALDQLMDELGKPGLAQVMRLVDIGAFNGWRTDRSMIESRRLVMIVAVVLAVAVRFAFFPLLSPAMAVTAMIAVVAGLAVGVVLWGMYYRNSRKPIDQVLPVVRVVDGVLVASDNQSAK